MKGLGNSIDSVADGYQAVTDSSIHIRWLRV